MENFFPRGSSSGFSCHQLFSIQFALHLTFRPREDRNEEGVAPVLKNPDEGWKVIIRPGKVTDQLGEWMNGPRDPSAPNTELTLNLIGGKEGEMHTKNCGFNRRIGPLGAEVSEVICGI
jgi:hypothetical protein